METLAQYFASQAHFIDRVTHSFADNQEVDLFTIADGYPGRGTC